MIFKAGFIIYSFFQKAEMNGTKFCVADQRAFALYLKRQNLVLLVFKYYKYLNCKCFVVAGFFFKKIPNFFEGKTVVMSEIRL